MKKRARKRSVQEYDKKNAGTIKKRKADYYQENKEDLKQKQAKYNAKHPDDMKRRQSTYNNLNRMAINERQRNRKAKAKKLWTQQDRYIAFKEEFREGVVYVCMSCHRALWKNQVKILFQPQIKKLLDAGDKLKEPLFPNQYYIQKSFKEFFEDDILMGKQKVEEIENVTFCSNCLIYIKKKQLPRIHVSNGLELDEQPEELNLTELEEQLIALDLVFMKIKELPTRRCNGIVDKVINVPLRPDDVKKTVESLPRPIGEAEVVGCQLKRKMDMKNVHLEAFVRPNYLINAVKKFQVLGNPFYEGIKINEQWQEPMETIPEETETEDADDVESEIDLDSDDDDDRLDAVKKYQSKQASHTCMIPIHPSDMVFVNETSEAVEKKVRGNSSKSSVVAPGEGHIPTNWLKSENFDVKSHPTKHPSGKFGLHHKRKYKISCQQYFNQRILNVDERFAKCIPYLFMSQQFVERWALESQINISGQKGKCKKVGDDVEVHVSDITSILKSIRGSPKYWQTAKNELLAKVKQLGSFHVFFTISCGEMRWSDVFVSILDRKGYKVKYLEDENGAWDGDDDNIMVEVEIEDQVEQVKLWDFVKSMEESKHDLLKDHTVLVTRHFDARVRSFIKNILMGPGSDKVEYEYYTYRVEMQQRGLPHIHGVAWLSKKCLEEHGIHGDLIEYPEATVKLVDKLMSCSLNTPDAKLNQTVSDVQRHKHTKSCLKYGLKCRYNFPKFPSKETILAQPLPEDMDKKEKEETLKECSKILEKAHGLLESTDLDENMTIEEFIKKVGVSEDAYYKALKTSKNGPMLVLKRQVNERFVNSYNPEILKAFDSNTDFQVAFDAYAVATYMINYVSKDESGMTDFLRKALSSAKDMPDKEKINVLKKCYLTHRQIGAPEAVYRLIQNMHLKDSNISTVFVQSGFPENRTTFFRKVSEDGDEKDETTAEAEENVQDDVLDESDLSDFEGADPEEVHSSKTPKAMKIKDKPGKYEESKSIHDKYEARPQWLESITLAQFATQYASTYKVSAKVKFDNDGVPQQDFLSDFAIINSDIKLPRFIKLQSEEMMRLRKPLVLRYHSSKKKEGHEKHYAEMLLFHPYRQETELHREDPKACIDRYNSVKSAIDEFKKVWFLGDGTVTVMDETDIEQQRPTLAYAAIDPQREQEFDDDRAEGSRIDPKYANFDYDSSKANEDEKRSGKSLEEPKYKCLDIPPNEEILTRTRKLADEQKVVVYKIVHHCWEVVKARHSLDPNERPSQLKIIVQGGAGAGKSEVIKVSAMHIEKILRYAGGHPNKPRVLLLAFTGKAAGLIEGMTINSALGIKFGGHYAPLGPKKLAELRDLLSELEIIIIDEFSLVGADMLIQVHQRLVQIFQTEEDELFAGKTVIMVGDLMQLPPVLATPIFKPPKCDRFRIFNSAVDGVFQQFEPYHLSENHRQGAANVYGDHLNQIRMGNVTQEAIELLKSRIVTDQSFLEESALHVMYTNLEVNTHNKAMLDTLQEKEYQIPALLEHPPWYSPTIDPRKGTVDGQSLLANLTVKVGARVKITQNISVVDNLVNGSLGEVVGIETNKKNGQVDYIIVKLDDPNAGEKQREKYPQRSQKYASQRGTPFKREDVVYQVSTKGGKKTAQKATVMQFPFTLAWAATGHTMQVNSHLIA